MKRPRVKKAAGFIRGHKITRKQQRFLGTARGMQKSGRTGGNSGAAKAARAIPAARLHKAAMKPKGGYAK